MKMPPILPHDQHHRHPGAGFGLGPRSTDGSSRCRTGSAESSVPKTDTHAQARVQQQAAVGPGWVMRMPGAAQGYYRDRSRRPGEHVLRTVAVPLADVSLGGELLRTTSAFAGASEATGSALQAKPSKDPRGRCRP
uniref:Uncharacterized protein n=1 Tax=Anopheles melas TaxID=34690 RepID=A0A182UBM8_9DIPT